jgi:hypothetical protein
MQHPYVGVEHLFLAIIRDQDAVPAQSLAQQISLEEVEARLLEVMNSPEYRTVAYEILDDPHAGPDPLP